MGLPSGPVVGDTGGVGKAADEAMFAPPAGSRVSNAKDTGRLPATNFYGIPATGLLGLLLRAAGRQG
jgi:hypothetical protein